RRLALKFSQRRRLIGDSLKHPAAPRLRPIHVVGWRWKPGVVAIFSCVSTSAAVSLGAIGFSLSSVRISIGSDLPALEVDPRIDQCVDEVRDPGHHQTDEREDIERCEYDRIVAVDDAFEAEQPEAIQRKDGYDQQRAAEEGGD